MSYAVRNDGKGWRSVNSIEDVGPDETYSDTQPPPLAQDPKQTIRAQIAELESTITNRRFREAVLTGDHSFIDGVDRQIAELRAQL